MTKLSCKSKVDDPEYVVECSGVSEFAYILAKSNNSFSKTSWSPTSDDDAKEIQKVNSALPKHCLRMDTFFTAKFAKRLAQFYVQDGFIVSFDEELIFSVPDAIFLQRISPYTKTFDMVCFYKKTYIIFSVVDRKDLQYIRDWYPKEIFSCASDPLPFKFIDEFLKTTTSKHLYTDLFNMLFESQDSSSCSEYEVESEESGEDYESDDAYESEIEDQYTDECSDSDDSDGEYKPAKKKHKSIF